LSEDEVVLRRCDGHVLIAVLNRPAKSNAINGEVLDALDQVAADVETGAADGVRAVGLTGAGTKAFSAGADIADLDGITADEARAHMRRGQAVFDRLERLPVVVIAAVNGVALGGGLELAMAADLRVASPSARLGQPEISLENLPGWGGTQRLPRLIGAGRALELILTGVAVSAERAHKIGLVNEVADDPLRRSVELAQQIGARSSVAVAGAKSVVRIGLTEGVAAGLEAEADAVARCCETPEQRSAVRAFLSRRAMRDAQVPHE